MTKLTPSLDRRGTTRKKMQVFSANFCSNPDNSTGIDLL